MNDIDVIKIKKFFCAYFAMCAALFCLGFTEVKPTDTDLRFDPKESIIIGRYQARLMEGSAQEIVDLPDTAAIWWVRNKEVIADHVDAGFNVIKSENIAYVRGIKYKKMSTYHGLNTRKIVRLDDGRPWTEVPDGDLIMITCADFTGKYVTVTYWKKA